MRDVNEIGHIGRVLLGLTIIGFGYSSFKVGIKDHFRSLSALVGADESGLGDDVVGDRI